MPLARIVIATCAVAVAAGLVGAPARAQTIIDEWPSVKAPPAPELKPVTIDTSSTALLLLDFAKQNCGQRPRCLASVPKVQKFADEARAKKMQVVHSLFGQATVADLLIPPAAGEPNVRSGADKFRDTALAKILADKGIRTVIVTGTAAHGAVLNTASVAALMGIKVIVPVDGMSADAFAEMYTAWHLANGPGGVGPNVTLTRLDLIKF
ncbi:MAG TPA: isochorismatase family protein [Xanthobacteraceae bacterium]|jgi:nicotinamidase-related amidase